MASIWRYGLSDMGLHHDWIKYTKRIPLLHERDGKFLVISGHRKL